MQFELTEQQQRLVHERDGQPIEVIDPQTTQAYVLIAREQFEKVRSLVVPPGNEPTSSIPMGIRLSQEALRRALPELLSKPRLVGQWAGYHGEECIGIAPKEAILIRECIQRGLRHDEYYIGWIDHCELIEEEEVQFRPQHRGDVTGFGRTS